VGDLVKISYKKVQFSKGFNAQWSLETFRVKEVRKIHPVPVYILEDQQQNTLQSTYYDEELIRVQNDANTDE
jgi:hypothetical protein